MNPTPPRYIEILLDEQRLTLWDDGRAVLKAAVSTARNGPGERRDSECTPRGWHEVCAKIGAGAPPGTVFVGRRPTGELYSPALRAAAPPRDWILTRILWLSGLEPGFNRDGEVDSRRRYIYIHGTPDDVPLGRPGSRGCVRLCNADVIRLFDLVEEGTPVLIRESAARGAAPHGTAG